MQGSEEPTIWLRSWASFIFTVDMSPAAELWCQTAATQVRMKLLRNVSAILEGAELGVVVLFAAALFIGLVLGVPGSLAWALYQEGRVLLAGLVAALPVLTVLGVARDLRAGRLSWLSGGLVALGILCLAYILVRFILE